MKQLKSKLLLSDKYFNQNQPPEANKIPNPLKDINNNFYDLNELGIARLFWVFDKHEENEFLNDIKIINHRPAHAMPPPTFILQVLI